jgi:hypothetical protein
VGEGGLELAAPIGEHALEGPARSLVDPLPI